MENSTASKVSPDNNAVICKASTTGHVKWRENNFIAIYLMVLINKLTFSQQSANLAQFDTKLGIGLTLGLNIMGKLIGNILFSKVALRYQIKTALLCSTFTAIFAAVTNLTMYYIRGRLHSHISVAVLQCCVQFLIGMGTGNKGAITTYISATVKSSDLSRANLRISCYENIGYTLGPLTVIALTYVSNPTLVSSLAHIVAQSIIVIILLLIKSKSSTAKIPKDDTETPDYLSLFKTVLRYIPLTTCSCAFNLYIAVAVSISQNLFDWDNITVIRYHAPTLIISALISTFVSYNMKTAMKITHINHIPRAAGMFFVFLSMVTLGPAIISIAEKEFVFHQSSPDNETIVDHEVEVVDEHTVYHAMTHVWLITCGLTLASFGNVMSKVNYFSLSAQESKGHPSHMGVIAAVWWSTSGFLTLLYGLTADLHLTVIIFPSVIALMFLVIFLAYYMHWVVTCRRTHDHPTIAKLAQLQATSARMLYNVSIYPFYGGTLHEQKAGRLGLSRKFESSHF